MYQPGPMGTRASTAFIEELTEALPRLRAGAMYMTRSRSDADDLVQATVTRALTAQHQYQPGTNMRGWLYRIMRNEFIDTVRSPNRFNTSLDEVPQHYFTVKACQEQSLEARDVMRSLRKLPRKHREAVMLCYVEGLSYDEIAVIQSCAVGTIKSRLFRARQAVQEMLGMTSPLEIKQLNAAE